VADDSPAPLPRRVPRDKQHVPGSGQETRPVGPAALPEDVVRRIRVALDAVRSEASRQQDASRPEAPDPPDRPTSLPRRVPGTSKGPEPRVAIPRAGLPSVWLSRPRSGTNEAPTDVFPPASGSPSGGGTEEITIRPVTADQPEPATTRPEPGGGPAVPEPTLAPQPSAEEPDRQGRPEEETGHRAKMPTREKNQPTRWTRPTTRRTKSPARRTKPPARASKPTPSRSSLSQQPAPQMALVFPPEPTPEESTIRPPATIMPDLDRRARGISLAILVLLLLSVTALVFLL
jgi:hypothetical protein